MIHLKRLLAVFIVATMLVAAASGGAAVAPTIDTSTSDSTSTTSELQDGTTINGTDGTADNESHTLQVNMTADDDVEFDISKNGTDYVAFENTSMDNHTANSNAGGHWNGTVTEDELDDLERNPNENVTTTVTAWNASNTSESTSIVVHWNFTDDRSVEVLDDNVTDDEDLLETFDESDSLTKITTRDIHTLEFTELDIEEREIDGDDTTVVLALPNDTVADHASSAIPDDVEDEDPMFRMTLIASADDGPTQPIRVYHEEIPDGVDEDDDTYGIYKDGGIGGEDGIEINVGDEYEDAEEFDITGTLNSGLVDATLHQIKTSSWNPLSLFGALSGITDALTGAAPVLLIGATTARRRRMAG